MTPTARSTRVVVKIVHLIEKDHLNAEFGEKSTSRSVSFYSVEPPLAAGPAKAWKSDCHHGRDRRCGGASA